jgi:dephospho-CoA kinase
VRILTVALTGGIATGKSIISRALAGPGFFIHSADRAAHELMLPGRPAWKRIVARFGRGILDPDQKINRQRLGKIVFSSPADRRFLDRVVHPLVLEKKRQEVRKLERLGRHKVYISEAALTIEAGLASCFDKVVLAYCPESVQVERLMKRDRIGREEALRKIRSQMPLADKIAHADYLIDTSGTLRETDAQAEKLRRSLLQDFRRQQSGWEIGRVSFARRARRPAEGS